MEQLYDLKKKLTKELEKYGERDLSSGSLDVVYKMSSAIKNICKILESDEDESSGYGMSRRSYDGGSSMDGGYSGRRGRDSMGRYTRDGGSYRSYGYSYHGNLAKKLEQLANEAENEQERREIEQLIHKIEQM